MGRNWKKETKYGKHVFKHNPEGMDDDCDGDDDDDEILLYVIRR